MGIKELALNSFKTKTVPVDEWGVSVLVREPSILALNEYLNVNSNHKEDPKKVVEAEIDLLISVLLDEDKQPIFTIEDKADLLKSYNLTHRKILNTVFDLISNNGDSVEKAKKK